MYELLRDQPLLAELTDWQLERLSPLALRAMLHAGQRVFREGDPADRMWLIIDGRVAIATDLPGPGTTVVERLGPGDALGWSWLLPPHRWQFDAVAIEVTSTIEFDGAALRALCHNDRILGFQLTVGLLGVVANRLRAARRTLAIPTRPPLNSEPPGIHQ